MWPYSSWTCHHCAYLLAWACHSGIAENKQFFSLHIFHPTCSGCLCAFKRIVFIFVFKWMMTLLEIAPLKQTLNWIYWLLFFWLSATAHICWQLVNGFQPPNNQVDCILVGDAEALKYFEVANTGNTNGQNTCGLTVRSPLFYDQNRPSQYNVSFVSFYTTLKKKKKKKKKKKESQNKDNGYLALFYPMSANGVVRFLLFHRS